MVTTEDICWVECNFD